jgi:hypothetical protein
MGQIDLGDNLMLVIWHVNARNSLPKIAQTTISANSAATPQQPNEETIKA